MMSVEVPYDESRGIQCSCMALMGICWMLLKRIVLWKPVDLDCILQKGDDLFKKVTPQKGT